MIMGLPTKLTAEEQALREKYALLKKKLYKARKVIQPYKVRKVRAVQAAGNYQFREQRRELQLKLTTETTTNNHENQKVIQGAKKEPQGLTIPAPSYAKELAKRKILSGELKIKKDSLHREFKRARGFSEKKVRDSIDSKDPLKNDSHGSSATFKPGNERQINKPPPSKSLYDNFVSGGTTNDSSSHDDRQERPKFGDRRKGRTIFVSGYGLTKEVCQTAFTRFGTVTNVHFEVQKGHGFVTFAVHDSADEAITEMNGEMVQGITLRVSMARRQPHDNSPWESRRPFDRSHFDRGHFDRSHGDRPHVDRNQVNRSHIADRSRDRLPSGNSTEVTSPNKLPNNGKDKPDRDLISYEEEFDF